MWRAASPRAMTLATVGTWLDRQSDTRARFSIFNGHPMGRGQHAPARPSTLHECA
jgi:hypothetical protein